MMDETTGYGLVTGRPT